MPRRHKTPFTTLQLKGKNIIRYLLFLRYFIFKRILLDIIYHHILYLNTHNLLKNKKNRRGITDIFLGFKFDYMSIRSKATT